MTGASDDAVQLVAGIVAHIRQIVGDGASYSMLHYGALEEGKRLGAAYSARDLAVMLGRFDALLSQISEIVNDDGSTVTVRVHASEFLRSGERAAQGIVVGLLEGSLSASRHACFKGRVVQPTIAGEVTIALTRGSPES